LSPDPAGGLRIDKIHLTVRGEVEGMDADAFVKTAEEAKATCPVSKALAGVDEMTVDAALEQ
jgi:osmotically inducible protein OsmC